MAGANERPVFSVDVECVATDRGHNDRAPSWVAVVNGQGECVYKTFVAVPRVYNLLAPITGHKAQDLVGAPPLESVVAEIKALLRGSNPPATQAVLVGQSIQSDIEWLQLEEGVDFSESVDLAQHFKAFNPRFGSTSFFTLQHTANTLLKNTSMTGSHDPEDDARSSVRLYNEFVLQPHKLPNAHKQLLRVRPAPSIAKQLGHSFEGVCMAKFLPDKCICGQPTGNNKK